MLLAGFVLAAAAPAAGDGSRAWGTEVAVDTGAVTSFDVTADTSGRIWVAIAYPDRAVGLYFSDDFGATWHGAWAMHADSAVRQLQLLIGQGDSAFLYLFMLLAGNGGDLWVARVQPDSGSSRFLPVAVGPDTIDDFSVTLDRDDHYYLYCLYANEQRTGRTGTFTRSLDFGVSWESGTDWWNAWDPCVTHTTGSTIHCVWRYALNGGEVHYAFNRYYGASGHWQPYRVVSTGTDQCFDPVVVQSDTSVESRASVWAFYTVGLRDSAFRGLRYSLSWDDGWSWAPGISFGEPFRDDWQADLAADRTGSNGYASLCYVSSGRRANDTAAVFWSCVNAYDLNGWLRPVKVSHFPVARAEAVAPKLVYANHAPMRVPGVLYSRQGNDGPNGVWFTGAWAGTESAQAHDATGPVCEPNPAATQVRTTVNVARAGRYSVAVYDPVGRKVQDVFQGRLEPGAHAWIWDRRLPGGSRVAAGAYFVVLTGPSLRVTRRLVLL